MSSPTRYHLDPDDLDRASAMLETELDRVAVSRPARALFAALQVVAYLFPPWIAAYLVTRDLGEGFADLAFGLQSFIPPLILLLAVLLLLNLPLIGKAWRQHRLARRMRALDLLEELGAGQAGAARRWLRIGLVLAVPLALLAMSLRTLGSGQATWGERALALAVCVALPISLLLFDRLLERLRRRIDYFRRVAAARRGLLAQSTEGARLELPEELARRIDGIESVRMLRRREEAIRRAAPDREGDCAVARSSDFRAAAGRLAAATRLRLEEALEDLAAAPRSGSATAGDDGHRSLAVPETDLVVRYLLDEKARRIDVLSLVSIAAGAAGSEPS